MKKRIVNIELSAVIEQIREISISVPEHLTDEAVDQWLRDAKNVVSLNRLTDEEGIYWEQAPGYPEVRNQKAGVLYCCESNARRIPLPKDLISSIEEHAGECEMKS